MCSFSIATECYGALEADHAHNDDDRYDMVECGAAGKPTLDLSDGGKAVALLLRTTT